jgi:hypothetical protein
MCGYVGILRTDVLKERVASIIRLERIREKGSLLSVGEWSALKIEVNYSSETSVLTGPTLLHITEDGILHS